MQEQEKRGPGRPLDPNTPKRKQVHLYLPEKDYEAIKAKGGSINTWLVKAAQEQLKREMQS